MSQKKRYLVIILAVLLVGAVAAAFAGGSEEEGEASSSMGSPGPEGAAERAPIPGVDTLDEAIEAANAMPATWDYDPDERFIYPEGADIPYPIQLDETLWASRLDSFEYYVLREKGTERAFSSPMNFNKESGTYYSRATGQPLFRSEDKYDSGTGWPSFTRPINPNAIVYVEDSSLFSMRIEVVDSLSGSHLGHVFPDGPPPTGQRYCINAASLIFVPDGEEPPPLLAELQDLAAAE
jgi:methionine-R-sulfoxide reductase